jgi:hypothetical protein
LHGGTYFNFCEPGDSQLTIEDITYGMSMLYRFAGHCRRFYSVAKAEFT